MSGTIGFGMVDPVLNNRRNKWYQKRYAIKIPRRAICKKYLDAHYTKQGGGVSEQNLFGSTVPVGSDHEAGTSYSLGMVFAVTVPGEITAVRVYKHPSEPATTKEIAIYALNNPVSLVHVPAGVFTVSGWNSIPITPLAVSPGNYYQVAAYYPDAYYTYTVGMFNTAVNNGSLIAPAAATVSGNGRLRAGTASLVMPDTPSGNGAWFGLDVTFSPT